MLWRRTTPLTHQKIRLSRIRPDRINRAAGPVLLSSGPAVPAHTLGSAMMMPLSPSALLQQGSRVWLAFNPTSTKRQQAGLRIPVECFIAGHEHVASGMNVAP